MKARLLVIAFYSLFSSQLFAQFDDSPSLTVMAGDTAGLIEAIKTANAATEAVVINLIAGEGGAVAFEFTGPADGFSGALPDITGLVVIRSTAPIVFKTNAENMGKIRLLRVINNGTLYLSDVTIIGFGTMTGDGGAISVENENYVQIENVVMTGNSASGNGGAVAVSGESIVIIIGSDVSENSAGGSGGAFSVTGSAKMEVDGSIIDSNGSVVPGSAAYVNAQSSPSFPALSVYGSQFSGNTSGALVDNPLGDQSYGGNTMYGYGNTAIINSTDGVDSAGNVFAIGASSNPYYMQSSGKPPPKTEALCNDFGTNAFMSFGYNIAQDGSCGLDQPTDLPNTDPKIVENDLGLWVAQAGSPIVDTGSSELREMPADPLPALPCGYRDLVGTARPQDGNGDGIFECDMGAMEVQGAGDVVAGHSGAFFNPARDGEGTYVEILNDTTAVVYTFTYRPGGSGPAWFIGVGDINQNAIVIDELLRPTGTSFGDGFDKDDVEFTPIGGMSMVFPDCEAAAPGGNVAYSGDTDLGYSGLITRATRLSNITGCTQGAAHPNAGLSGSYFDINRDGEGIIVEWLTNGDVLVVFFTYDQNDNQLWLLGIGTPTGNTVTMEALYPSTYTEWGLGYDANDKTISSWGSFTLTWTECDAVNFDYSSTVAGFGNASHNYQRLSRLQGTTCPAL